MADFWDNTMRGAGWIQTFGGKRFDLLNPRAEDIEIEDIGRALSRICRYTGHSKQFFSVAQHSVLVSVVVDKPYQLHALLHDATEAYIGDISSPLKKLIPGIKEIEARIEGVIAQKFGLSLPPPEAVVEADLRMLSTEKSDVMGKEPCAWGDLPEPYKHVYITRCWLPDEAFRMFMLRYRSLIGELEE